MLTLYIIFWVLFAVIFYTYIGYGVILWLYLKLRGGRFYVKGQHIPDERLPKVTIIIAAYNEQHFINEKMANTMSLHYPSDKMRVIIITDGSTDDTADIVRAAAEPNGIIHLHKTERTGKAAAINRAVEYASDAEILIFSDANSLLNPESVKYLALHYEDPLVGGVAGEKKIISNDQKSVHGKGEGLYWKYESVLKKIDSDFYTVVGAAGELFSVRKNLFEKIPENIILDDFLISMAVCRKGFVVKYEPAAFAMETPSLSIADEQRRKVRISAGSFQAMSRLKDLFNIFRYGKLTFQFISRNALRWALCPFALPLLLLVNLLIMFAGSPDSQFYFWFGIAQLLFYLAALIGWISVGRNSKIVKLFYVPFYFVFMHMAVWAGLIRYLKGEQSAVWEKSSRSISNSV